MQKLLFHKYWCKRKNQKLLENIDANILHHMALYILTSLKSRTNLCPVSIVKYFNSVYSTDKSHVPVVPVNVSFTERPRCSIRYPTTNCLPKPKMPKECEFKDWEL